MEHSRLSSKWAILALLFGLGVALLHPGEGPGLLAAFDNQLLDLRFKWRGPRPATDNVAIVAIDDRTIAELGRFPVPRRVIAATIDQILKAGAGAIAVDLLLLERETPHDGNVLSPGDQLLLETLSKTDRVVLAGAAIALAPGAESDAMDPMALANAFGVVESESGMTGESKAVNRLLSPIEPFARRAGTALVNVATEPDGSLRRLPLAVAIGKGVFMPALPLEALRRQRGIERGGLRLSPGVAAELGPLAIPIDHKMAMAIDFLGPRGTIPTYSLIDVAKGSAPPGALRGRIVFIGATALGFGDVFRTPFAAELPGVEVLASVAENLSRGRVLRRDSFSWNMDLALGAMLALLAFLAANLRQLPISGLLYLGLWPLAAGSTQYLFQQHYLWLDGASQVATLAAIGIAVYGARFLLQRRIAGRLGRQRDNLAAYQSPLLADQLAGSEAPDFAGRVQEATILFVDVSGFTSRAQSMGPEAISEFLRALHRLFERAALAHGGVIERFAGDGAMLIFGLPEARADDGAEALACARDMMDAIAKWSAELVAKGETPIGLRAGLHCGMVMAARLGGERQKHMTVSGDIVNVASRLLDIAKRESVPIAATSEFADSVAAADRSDLLRGQRLLRGETLRGRAGPIDLYLLD